LAYVDAPEHNQEHGLESKQWLAHQFLITSSASLRFINYDEKHGRHIADVFINAHLGDVFIKNCSVSWLMAATGNAWAYYDFLTKNVEKAYLDAQYFARKIRRIGLWTNNLYPTPPWFFRSEEKGENILLRLEPA
jgi:Staphylococcal nuclease homologue